MTARRIYTAATRQRAPLDLEQLDIVDLLGVLLRSRHAARAILRAFRQHPELWDVELAEFMRTLTKLEAVGPSTAANFVIAEIYAGRRQQIPSTPTPSTTTSIFDSYVLPEP